MPNLSSALLAAALAVAAEPRPLVVEPKELQWRKASTLPAGAQIARILGDSTKPGPAVYRLRFPRGYELPPHTHETDETITVLSGSVLIGFGERAERGGALLLRQGAFAHVPGGRAHFGWIEEDAVVEIHTTGPRGTLFISR